MAIEFRDPVSGLPDAQFTRAVQQRALERGLIVLACGVSGNVIRFLFPLTITDALLDEGVGIFCAAAREALLPAMT